MADEFGAGEALRQGEARYLRVQRALELRIRLLQRRAEALKAYETFLRHVCAAEEEFRTPEGVRQRFEGLLATK